MSGKSAYCLTCLGEVVYLGTYKSHAHSTMIDLMAGHTPWKFTKTQFLKQPVFEVWTEPGYSTNDVEKVVYDVQTIEKFYSYGVADRKAQVTRKKAKNLGIRANSGEMEAYEKGWYHASLEATKSKDFKGYYF